MLETPPSQRRDWAPAGDRSVARLGVDALGLGLVSRRGRGRKVRLRVDVLTDTAEGSAADSRERDVFGKGPLPEPACAGSHSVRSTLLPGSQSGELAADFRLLGVEAQTLLELVARLFRLAEAEQGGSQVAVCRRV